MTHDLKLFRGLMCCRSRNSCSRPRLSLVSWCRACGPIFGVLLVPFIALVPRFPWPSRSSFWAFFVVVVCVLGSCSGLTLSRCIPPHFILLHQPHLCLPWSTLVLLFWATCMGHNGADLEISLEIGGLRVTVSGPSAAVGDFVQYLSAYQPRARSPDPFHWIF